MNPVQNLHPTALWNYFFQVTQVPRPSKKESKIIAFLENFAKEQQLTCKKDAAGNVLISKPATQGFENRQTTILQSHMDMVCEKNSDVTHDFDNDPIQLTVDGDWLKANGTTLGADNGIGIAAQLAVLADNTLQHGNIECLFTVDEETGLTGADAIQDGFLTGDILLNLDSEEEGEIFIGCAGGKNTTATFIYTPCKTTDTLKYLKLTVKGLEGGHSGSDIHTGRANANKLLARLLLHLKNNITPLTIASVNGGNLHNAIPREATAIVGVPLDKLHDTIAQWNSFAVEVEKEFKSTDPHITTKLETTKQPDYALDDNTANALVNALVACPHGVIRMSQTIQGLVETSTNLASVKTLEQDGKIVITTSQRSSIESAKNAIAQQVAVTLQLAGADVTHSSGYPGWTPNPDSKILEVAKNSYGKLFGKQPKIMAIHAGLECGLFLKKYPHLDMISFGPTLRDVHSPNERIQISSVLPWWKLLTDVLQNIPAK